DLAVDVGTAVGKIIKFWSKVFGFFKALPGKIMGFLKGLPGKFLQLGKDMISGVVKGIKSAAGKVKDAAVGAAKKAYEGAKDFLGINSPSILYKHVGLDSMRGWVRGMKAMSTPLVSASGGLAAAAYDPWRGTSPLVPGVATGPQNTAFNVNVRLGERELRDLVVDAVRSRPDAVASTVAHGQRLNDLRR
ncbi:MAG: phage tail protein, partial [Stackebrandtia sp.]